MATETTVVTTISVTCDNCGDAIYSGDAMAFDMAKVMSLQFPTVLGGFGIRSFDMCTGTTCAHNCYMVALEALNTLPGKATPTVPPIDAPPASA